MRNRFVAALIASSLWLTGCELLMSSNVTLSNGSAALLVRPEILSGGYRTQALVKAYTAEDIDHLVLQLFRLEGDKETAVVGTDAKAVIKRIPASKLGDTLTFDALQPNTTYRLRAFAYKAPGEDPKDLISAPGAASYTDVTLTNDDRPVSTTLKVKLADVLFNGMATASGIEVIPGGFSTDRNVSIHLGDVVDLVPSDSPLWAEYFPKPVPGMKWVYAYSRTSGGKASEGTVSFEVLAVDGNTATYRTETSEGTDRYIYEDTMRMAYYNGAPLSYSSLERVGVESLTVPMGSYPEAGKFFNRGYSADSTLWLVKGIGRVKEESAPPASMPSGDHFVITLTQFITP